MKNKETFFKRISLLDTIVLGIVMAIRAAYFYFCNNISKTPDSLEYIRVNGISWLFGNIDRFRMPAYPFLIDVCLKLFGDNYLKAVCAIQLFASLLSLVALYFMLRKLTPRRYIYLPLTALYGLSVTVLGWDKVILTESLSLSLTVFMLFGLVYYLKDNKLRYLAVAVAAAGIGAFMRSVFSIYAGIILGFLVIRLIFTGKKSEEEKKSQRKTDAKGMIFAVIPVLLLLVYGYMFSVQYGAFTLSDSGIGQQLAMVLENGYYLDSSDEELKEVANDIMSGKVMESYDKDINKLIDSMYDDALTEEQTAEIKAFVTQYISEDELLDEAYAEELVAYFSELYGNDGSLKNHSAAYRARCYIVNNFDRERVNAFISEAKRANLKEYVLSLRFGTYYSFSAGYESDRDGIVPNLLNPIIKGIVPAMNVYLLQGLLVGLIELIVYIIILIKKKYSAWIHLGLAVCILATGILAVVGTNAEFARTAITMFPMLYVVFALWADAFMGVVIRKELKSFEDNEPHGADETSEQTESESLMGVN